MHNSMIQSYSNYLNINTESKKKTYSKVTHACLITPLLGKLKY